MWTNCTTESRTIDLEIRFWYQKRKCRSLRNKSRAKRHIPLVSVAHFWYNRRGTATAVFSAVVEISAKTIGDVFLRDLTAFWDIPLGGWHFPSIINLVRGDIFPYYWQNGEGLLVVPESKVEQFKKLLVSYYEGRDEDKIIAFFKEECWRKF